MQIFQNLANFIRGKKTAADVASQGHRDQGSSASSSAGLSDVVSESPGLAVYPPTDEGLPLSTVQDLLLAQEQLIQRIRTHAATKEAIFETRYMTPIRNLAAYILNLPATPDGVFGGPAGLFRACLELAFFSFQASDGSIFTGPLGVEQRYTQEPRWRYICFAAGLIWPIGKTIEAVRVSCDGKFWPARMGGLQAWAQQNGCDRLYLTWSREAITEPGPSVFGSTFAVQMLGADAGLWIEQDSPRLMSAYVELCQGQRNDFNSIAFDLIKRMWHKVMVNERSRMPANYGRVKFGAHMAPHMVDAMASLVRERKWVVNQHSLVANSDGVMLIWPKAGHELVEILQSRKWLHAPATEEGLLNMLIDEGLIQVDGIGGVYTRITDPDGEIHMCVKLASPTTVMPDYNSHDFENASFGVIGEVDPGERSPVLDTTKVQAEAIQTRKDKDDESTRELSESNAADTSVKAPTQFRKPPPPAADPLGATLGVATESEAESSQTPVAQPPISDAISSSNSPSFKPPTRPVVLDADEVGVIEIPGASTEQESMSMPAATVNGGAQTKKSEAGDKKGSSGEISKKVEAAPDSKNKASTKPPYGEQSLQAKKATNGSDFIYKDTLSPSVIKSINNTLVSEQLSRLIKKINEGDNKKKIIKNKDYAAVPWDFFDGVVVNPPNFLTVLGEAGYLYFDPTARGKKMHQIPVEPNSKETVRCFLMAKVLASKIGLM